MISIEDLKRHYFLTTEDEHNLQRIGQIVLPYADDLAADFYEYLANFPEAAALFRTKEAIEKRKETIKRWLSILFAGKYDHRYAGELQRIGSTHVRKEIPIHWVTASMNFKRDYLIDILERDVKDESERRSLTKSLEKILDINLDIMTSSYHEEEIKKTFLSKQMDSLLITFAERFTYGLNLILVLALIGLSIGVIVLFLSDIQTLLVSGKLETGILSSLGTLLIIWVMVELMTSEINYLKGERFHIEIFVSVALVALIRELLISTLAHEPMQKIGMLSVGILILGTVYYLISKTELRP